MILQSLSKQDAVEAIKKRLPQEVSQWITVDSLSYWAWPEVFGSTAGPFGGCGGRAMTTFTIEAWEQDRVAVIFCGNKILKVVDSWEGPQSVSL